MFIIPHLDNSNIAYDQNCNNIFHQKIESMWYKAAHAITDSSRKKLCSKLGLEFLQQWWWYINFVILLNISQIAQSLKYLFEKTSTFTNYRPRNISNISQFNIKYTFSRYTFFQSIFIKWNNLTKVQGILEAALFSREGTSTLYNNLRIMLSISL